MVRNPQFDAFSGNATVEKAVSDHGISCLPLILLHGKIVSHNSYPNREELAAIVARERAATPVHAG